MTIRGGSLLWRPVVHEEHRRLRCSYGDDYARSVHRYPDEGLADDAQPTRRGGEGMSDEVGQSLADKLNRLFRTIRTEDGREHSPEHVADWLRTNGGPSVSPSYIYMLRRGQRTNPTKMHIEGLARFFDIAPGYFFDDALSARIGEELDLLAALRDADVRYIALRSSELRSPARRSIIDILQGMSWAARGRPSSTSTGADAQRDDEAADREPDKPGDGGEFGGEPR